MKVDHCHQLLDDCVEFEFSELNPQLDYIWPCSVARVPLHCAASLSQYVDVPMVTGACSGCGAQSSHEEDCPMFP